MSSLERLKGVTVFAQPLSPQAEAYRQLRTNILYSAAQPHTILVTSPSTGEEKGAVLANLAVCLAQDGNNVIAVDADLRQPCLHSVFGVSNEVGLTDLLVNPALAELPLENSGVQGLSILTSGPSLANPTALLGPSRIKDILNRLRPHTDYLLIDAPPVLAASDAAALAPLMDGVLLIIRAGKTQRAHAQKALSLLERVNARLLGLVLTDAKHQIVPRPHYGAGPV